MVLVGACAGTATTPTASERPSAAATATASAIPPASREATASSDAVSGVIAIGHSGLTGEGTGAVYEAVPENSWATGTSPTVNSIYERLRAQRPDLAGSTSNTAHGGAVASELPEQASLALKDVPHPALAIISTIDNDITCDGKDAAHVPELGTFVAAALAIITKASPQTKILVIGQLGRPSIAFVKGVVAADPSAKATLTGSGPCDFYTPDGKLAPAHFQTLTAIIQAYEDEEAARCAKVPTCATDGGVRAAWVDRIDWYAGNTGHLNVAGQAAEAANLWPVVARMFGLPPS